MPSYSVVAVVKYCVTSLFGTNGHLSCNTMTTVHSIDEMNDVQMMT